MSTVTDTIKGLREWYPLESSPEVFTRMARSWGLSEKYTFHDVLGLDTELLDLVPRPVHAVIFLFPDTPEIVAARTADGPCLSPAKGQDLLWIPQVDVGHSCGTFAVIHALAATGLTPGLNDFVAECQAAEPAERTKIFASNRLIYDAHHSVVTAGQSIPRETDWEDCDHFLSFVHGNIDGHKHLIELDGNAPRNGPLDRGISGGELLAPNDSGAVKSLLNQAESCYRTLLVWSEKSTSP